MRRAVVLCVLLALAACEADYEAKVGGALLPQAFGVVPAGEGATLTVKPGTPAPTVLPMVATAADPRVIAPVKLAIDIHVPWKDVKALLDRADQAGIPTRLLVGQRYRVRGFVLSDRLELGQALRVRALKGGKFCVSPPGTEQAYCLESGDRQHISALFVRGVMEKAVAQYGIAQARITPDPDLAWADLVRAIDGTRTCCPGMKVMVVR